MVDRVAVAMTLTAPVAVLAMYQGMAAAGLLPLALFGPAYAIARWATDDHDLARVEGVRLTAAATLGAALAILPALAILGVGPEPIDTRATGIGVGLAAAGVGTLAGLAVAPEPRRLRHGEKRRWTIVEALDRSHARGLALLLVAAVPAVTLLVLVREAPLFVEGPGPQTLPDALVGSLVLDGRLVLPDPGATLAIAVPLSLAPVAVGFLTSPRTVIPIGLGGVAVLAATPIAVALSIPVQTPAGRVPLDLSATPGVDALVALAPAGAGLLLGAGVTHVGRRLASTRVVRSVLWAATGAVVVLLGVGLLPGLAIAAGVAIAAAAVSWATRDAPLGAALAAGALVGGLVGLVGPIAQGLAVGTLVGIVVAGAVVSASTARLLLLPRESVRSPRTLGYLLVMATLGGAIAWLAATRLGAGGSTFPYPHARGLAAALDALLSSHGDLILLWGLVAGASIQWLFGRGGLFAVGFLIGPGVAALVVVGSLLRAAWEGVLLERAREGFVMRGELGYELLRAHVLVVAVLAGEAIAVALGPLIR